jgi:hypothetical protein
MEIVALLALTQKLLTLGDSSSISVFTGVSGDLANSGKGTPARIRLDSHADFTSARETLPIEVLTEMRPVELDDAQHH